MQSQVAATIFALGKVPGIYNASGLGVRIAQCLRPCARPAEPAAPPEAKQGISGELCSGHRLFHAKDETEAKVLLGQVIPPTPMHIVQLVNDRDPHKWIIGFEQVRDQDELSLEVQKHLVWSNTGRFLACFTSGNRVNLCDYRTSANLVRMAAPEWITPFSDSILLFSPDDTKLCLLGINEHAHGGGRSFAIADLTALHPRFAWQKKFMKDVACVAWGADGSSLFVARAAGSKSEKNVVCIQHVAILMDAGHLTLSAVVEWQMPTLRTYPIAAMRFCAGCLKVACSNGRVIVFGADGSQVSSKRLVRGKKHFSAGISQSGDLVRFSLGQEEIWCRGSESECVDRSRQFGHARDHVATTMSQDFVVEVSKQVGHVLGENYFCRIRDFGTGRVRFQVDLEQAPKVWCICPCGPFIARCADPLIYMGECGDGGVIIQHIPPHVE